MKNKIFLMAAVYVLVFLFLPNIAQPLWNYIKLISVPILIGLLLGGVVDWLVPGEYVSKLLAGKKKRTIIYAVISGFLMTACSHGILAISIQLYKKGASAAAVVAFLLASPWANLPLTIMMFGFFGIKALYIIMSAIIIALITGYVYLLLDGAGLVEKNPNTREINESFSVVRDIQTRFSRIKYGISPFINAVKTILTSSVDLANMVLWWIMFGMLLASIAAAFIPSHFLHQYMGPTILGLLVTLVIATVIEVCSEGSAPLAFEIYRQTGAFGNSLVFLMAGVSTDYTEIGLIWANIGWRAALWLPVITVPQVILLGWIANLIF